MGNAAVSVLEVMLEVLENNEPINRREGNLPQANLERSSAVDIRAVLDRLAAPTQAINQPKFNQENANGKS